MQSTAVFPPVVVQVFSSAAVRPAEEMLEQLAVTYDRQLTTSSQRLTAVLSRC